MFCSCRGWFFYFIELLLNISLFSFSQQIAITPDGKKVQLIKNETYKFIKDDSTEKALSYINESDFTKEDGKVFILTKKVNLKNAEDENVPVNFSFISKEEEFKLTSIFELNEILSKANLEAMYKMKNKFTYVPKKVLFSFDETKNRWIVEITYTAQNDYGATKDGSAIGQFTIDGYLYEMIIL